MNACKVLELATASDVIELIKLAELEIKELAIKEKHGKTELQRFKKIKKYLESNTNENFKTTWIDGDYQCFTNGYTGFLLKNHMNELPVSQSKPMELLKHLPQNVSNYILVSPEISDIKAKIKIHKGVQKNIPKWKRTSAYYDINESRYNAQYIIDCYEILGCENTTFKQPPNGNLDPSILENENGISIILPVRKPKSKEKRD